MFTNHWHAAQWRRKAEVAALMTTAVAAFGILLPIAARAQTETVLYSFTYPIFTPAVGCPPGTSNANPHAGLLFYSGHLFGTTPEGGDGAKAGTKPVPDSKDGMVFRLTKPASGGTPWNKDILHSFQPEPNTEPPVDDGTYPCSRLIDNDGVLIGTTMKGGNGFGTIFSLTPPITGETAWTETQLYSFMESSDGGEPYDGLVMGSNGALYGVTRLGREAINASAVFQFLDGQITQIAISSDCTYSTNPPCVYNGDLLIDNSTGSLFGTTQNGGVYGYGNVFELTPSGGTWNYADLYDFTGGSDGATPNGGLVGGPGPVGLLGTTQGGGGSGYCSSCGVLFELRQEIAGNPYTLIVQHAFAGEISNDGAVPFAGLYKDSAGTLWGTTEYGGEFLLRSDLNFGTIFKLSPSSVVGEWDYALVYRFGGEPDGANPQGLLTEDKKGNLYGTTNAGGSANEGTVFELTP